ncbi:hypothetical protein OAE92_02325 [Akkermansiaceae bacterium]|nr:hypothetical protein [Akkermansiaceae bacterium]
MPTVSGGWRDCVLRWKEAFDHDGYLHCMSVTPIVTLESIDLDNLKESSLGI